MAHISPFTPNEQILSPHVPVFQEGDIADHLYEVVHGFVFLSRRQPNGRRRIVEIAGPGDLFGFSLGPLHTSRAETLSSAHLNLIHRSEIERKPEVMRKVMCSVQAKVERLHEHSLLLQRKSALERVAHFLADVIQSDTTKDVPSEPSVILIMSRRQIADYLGLTLETVSRCFTELCRRGLIVLGSHRRLTVADPSNLRRLAGCPEDYG